MLGESLIQDAKAQDLHRKICSTKKRLVCRLAVMVDDGAGLADQSVGTVQTRDYDGFDSSMDYAWIYRSILESVG